jgi:hypothetical protein
MEVTLNTSTTRELNRKKNKQLVEINLRKRRFRLP